MLDHPCIAIGASITMPASTAQGKRRIATPVQKQQRLLISLNGRADLRHHLRYQPGALRRRCGGADGETLFDDMWAFDVASETWREAGRKPKILSDGSRSPEARFGHACAATRVDALVGVASESESDARAGGSRTDPRRNSLGSNAPNVVADAGDWKQSRDDASDASMLLVHGGVARDSRVLRDLSLIHI